MKQQTAQEIAHSYFDPDTHEFLCISLESDIHNLVDREVSAEAKKWEDLLHEEKKTYEQKLALLKKRSRIIQMATRRHLKRAL